MKTRLRVARFFHPAALLVLVAVLAYGLLLPRMGFYWDELPMSWIRYELGPEAMTTYFSTNRPVWGALYQITTRFLPQIPIYWEIFGLLWRWLAAVLVWGIARHLWRGREGFAVATALCFLVYPGFNQQWTSYLYSHFLIVLCFLLLSFLCTIWSVRARRWYLPLTAAALILSGLNLWMMEYFFVLELWRPFLIWGVISDSEGPGAVWSQVRRALILWMPYLAVFLANVLWRLFVFNNQIYQPVLLTAMRARPLQAVMQLAVTIGQQLYTVTVAAWANILSFPTPARDGLLTTMFYAAVVLSSAVLVAGYVWSRHETASANGQRAGRVLLLGLAAMVAAGGPFWLTGLEVTTAYPANRFTLPFILGVSIALAAALDWAPARIGRVLLVALVGLAAGRQALWGDSFRRDWVTQKDFFWQMVWRAPGIVPHTIILLNEGALPYYADNSLTAPLNWIYDPNNRSSEMEYVLFYPTSRVGGTLAGLEPGQPVDYDFIAEVFHGNTSQTLAFYFQPPGCLRLLDPAIDPQNHFVSDDSLMREAARLSSSAWITDQATARMPSIYGPEPVHGWCYYFERAQLAAQFGEWSTVARLGETAFGLDDYPNDPIERFVFIEGYAHAGEWSRAIDQSDTAYGVSKQYVGPLLCTLWARIEQQTPASPQKAEAMAQVQNMLRCKKE